MSKKLKIYLLAVLTFLVSIFSLTACGKILDFLLDEETPVGTYYFYSITSDENTVYVGDTIEDFTYTADAFVITLMENGEMTVCIAGNDTASGTWTQDGNTLVLTANGEALNVIWDADSLTIEYDEMIMVLKK